MGAQWKHAGRQQNAAKKGAAISKLVKEIMVSVKMGDSNPDNNSRLRAALEAARKASVPRDTIDRAIKKASGQLDGEVQFETILYEGFTPHRVPVIVECLTDNKNRTASDIRVLFRKGQLGSIGTVGWMFDRQGVVEASKSKKDFVGSDSETVAIEAGAQSVEPLESEEIGEDQVGFRFYCDTRDLDSVSRYLNEQKWSVVKSELAYIAKTPVDLQATEKAEVIDFLNAIDDHEDVHRVYVALP